MSARSGNVWGVAAALSALLSASCAPDPEVSSFALTLQQLPAQECALGNAPKLTAYALGDFPTKQQTLGAGNALSIDDFPIGTRELAIEAVSGSPTQIAWGRLPLTAAVRQRDVLLLPLEKSCALGDPLALALPGAAVAALPDGSLLIAGGAGASGAAVSSVLVLPAGQSLVAQVPSMLLRRAYASASVSGELVLIAGGALDDRSSAHETYEIFDTTLGVFQGALSQQLLTGPRMQHAAAVLPDGRVLLLGGRTEPTGPALDSGELIDPASGVRVALTGASALLTARIAPSVLTLDDGKVLVIGGHAAASAADGGDPEQLGVLVGSIERFDVASRRFQELGPMLPSSQELVASALPGGRVAILGCNTLGARGCTLRLLVPASTDSTASYVEVEVESELKSLASAGLSDLRMVTLSDGRLLLTASDPSDVSIARRAFVIDPSSGSARALPATRVASTLIELADGTLVELDAFGGSLRRMDARSVYDSPSGNLITKASSFLALDAPGHWQQGAVLSALVDDARFAVAGLTFADVQVSLTAAGQVSLLWTDTRGKQVSIELGAGRLRAAGCNETLADGASLVARRQGETLALSAGGKKLCSVAVLAGELRLGLVAALGSSISRLELTRL